MEDHDQRMKVLLREFFEEFIRLFFPQWAERFDFGTVTWLDKEIFPDPPRGERTAADLVARLTTRAVPPRLEAPEDWLALVHIELESADKAAPLRRRMFHYYSPLSRDYNLPVLPLAVYMRVGLEGLGWDVYEESFWGQPILRLTYPYVGLPALDAEQYVRQDNWLGVALSALMRVTPERRLELGQEAWRRLIQCPENAYRRYLLCECLDAYLPQNDDQRRNFEQTILTDPDPGVRTMSMTIFEKFRQEGRAEGIAEGSVKGQRDSLLVLLETRFGPLTPETKGQIERLTPDRIREVLVAQIRAQSLNDLNLGG
jgi:hypothetical protein